MNINFFFIIYTLRPIYAIWNLHKQILFKMSETLLALSPQMSFKVKTRYEMYFLFTYHITVIVLCLSFNFLDHSAFGAYLHLNGCELLHNQRLMTFMCIAYFMEHLFFLLKLCDAYSLFILSTPPWHFVDRKMLIADSDKPFYYGWKDSKKSNVWWCLGKVNIYPNVLGSSSVEVKSGGCSTDSWQCLKPNQHLRNSYNKDVYIKMLKDTSSYRTT